MLVARTKHPDQFLTTGDVAKLLGVTNQYVQALARDGKLPVADETAGGIRLFRRGEIERIAEERQRTPPRRGPNKGHGGRPPTKKKTRKVAKKKTGVRKKK